MVSPKKAENTTKFFIGRQSILDRNQDLAGFELLFRSGQKNSAHFLDDVTATASVISHAFNELGFRTTLGKHRGFINVSADMLLDDTIELLPSEQVVIELLESVDLTPAVLERCTYLKSQGYLLALDDVCQYSVAHKPLCGVIDFIKIDLRLVSANKLDQILAPFRSWPVKLIAEKVDNPEEAQLCMDAGFHLFQGYYFAKPIIITGKRLTHSEVVLMQLLGKLIKDAPTAEIETLFKQNPGLTLALLRLVNSIGVGIQKRITSIADAITLFGRRQLKRWLQLLVYTGERRASSATPLLQLAAARGRCMELLVQRCGRHSKELEDHAFMVGIMSLMDALLGIPLAEIITPLNPPPEIRDALLSRTGLLGRLLLLMEHLEAYNMEAANQVLEDLAPLTVEQVNAAALQALAWSNSFGEEAA
jgi:c-di-GMP-related signal transduction protein